MKEVSVQIMDIYPKMLEDAYSLCEAILTENYGYTEKEFFQMFDQDLEEHGLDNLSNKIVGLMFLLTADLIRQKDPKADVDYYVNGCDNTEFYINGEKQ